MTESTFFAGFLLDVDKSCSTICPTGRAIKNNLLQRAESNGIRFHNLVAIRDGYRRLCQIAIQVYLKTANFSAVVHWTSLIASDRNDAASEWSFS
jgi:hypothetical protein